MKNKAASLFGVLAVLATSGAQAQVEPGVPIVAPAVCCKIAASTPIIIELLEQLSSASKLRGDKFPIRLAEAIKVDDQTIIPAGTTGVGEVVDAARAGMGGKPGELVLAARYLTLNGIEIKLRSLKLSAHGEDSERGNQAATLALTVIAGGLVGLVAATVKGGDLIIPYGTRAEAKIAVDVTLPPVTPATPDVVASENKPKTEGATAP